MIFHTTIYDISQMAKDFYYENPLSVNKVEKIIVSVGTNEVKYFNSHKYDIHKRFRSPIINLVKSLKQMYPNAQIIFQTVLPIQIKYVYTAESVHTFNTLLLNVCEQFGCIYFDCFSQFLDVEGWDYNRNLYRDNIHLNDNGLKLLCRALKFVIHRNIFNPHPRISYYHNYNH